MKMKSQSAMEYLMTYGWAILIVAVVLGAIYSLGIFNGATLAPRAQPGACEVLRPNGALTTQYMSLAGACTNELPQYVAQFNGAGSYILVQNSPSLNIVGPITVSVWVKNGVTSTGAVVDKLDHHAATGGYSILLGQVGGTGVFDYGVSGGADFYASAKVVNDGSWHNLVITNTASLINFYVDGMLVTSTGVSGITPLSWSGNLGIGYPPDVPTQDPFNGLISNVQIYNTSLDANSVKALYQEGIGGAPIRLQNLTAWWPLNGNPNDYSGDLNNGAPTNVIYTNQWLSGYTIP